MKTDTELVENTISQIRGLLEGSEEFSCLVLTKHDPLRKEVTLVMTPKEHIRKLMEAGK